MLLSLVGVGKTTGGLDYNLGSDGFPGQGGWIFFFENLDDLAVDGNAIGTGRDRILQVSQNRVVLQQVGEGLGVGEIVDGDEVKILVRECGAQYVASYASKSINANFNGHCSSKRNVNA